MERKIKVLILALFMLGINNLAMGEEFALPNKEAVERLVRVEEGQKRLEQGQKVLSDRLIKVEEGQKEVSDGLTKVRGEQRELLVKFDEWQKGVNQRIDDLKNLIYALLVGILGLIAFVLWDRISTISPMMKKLYELDKELDKRQDLFLKILKEYAIKEPKMAEVLKSLGFL